MVPLSVNQSTEREAQNLRIPSLDSSSVFMTLTPRAFGQQIAACFLCRGVHKYLPTISYEYSGEIADAVIDE